MDTPSNISFQPGRATRALRVALAYASVLPTATSLAEPSRRVFTPQDVFALQRAEYVQILLDARSVAYVRVGADIMTDSTCRRVWSVDLTTGEQIPLVPGAVWSPRWSLDGDVWPT